MTTLYEIQMYRAADGWSASWVVEGDSTAAGLVPEGVSDYADLQCRIAATGEHRGDPIEVTISEHQPVRVTGRKGVDRQTRGAWNITLTAYDYVRS